MDNIKDDDTYVENFMNNIKKNMERQKDVNIIDSTKYVDIKQYMDYISSNWNLQTDYVISSHRPIIGRLLIWGRRLIHGETRRYVDPMVRKQEEFNSHVVKLFNNYFNFIDKKMNESIASINSDIDKKMNESIASINSDIDKKMNESIASINNDIDKKMNESIASINNDIDKKMNESITSINNDIDKKDEIDKTNELYSSEKIMNYFVFEEKYRGSTDDIKQRQLIYLEYFKKCKNVLDIGCGRGEFLSLLKENGIGAKGIDIDEDMILFCKKNDLDVIQIDAISYLEPLENKSLDGIFTCQVVEHLQPSELIDLIKLCYEKMKYGTYFTAETINPQCLSAIARYFYMDISHVKPVHPETIKFLMESVGFRNIEIKFISPCSDAEKLGKIEINDEIDDRYRQQLEIMNQNFNKLNDLLFGYQDYAIIGKK